MNKPNETPSSAKLYGIKNCDTVKKARQWLAKEGIEHQFYDFRSDGLNKAQIELWRRHISWELLLNKRSTTWKQLSEADRKGVNSDTINQLLLTNPTLIKRPVLEYSGKVHLGFKPPEYDVIFKQNR